MTAPNTQIAGQSLTLQCEVTTVRGITNRVDIVWSSDGTELNRTENIMSTMMINSLVYTDNYTISLGTTDDGKEIQCQVMVINTSSPVMASDSITLDVTSMYIYVCYNHPIGTHAHTCKMKHVSCHVKPICCMCVLSSLH